MITYEIEFHKVSSLPLNKENYRGHVFFNDATNEPTVIDEEGNESLLHEKGIYLCAYDKKGNLDYISYTLAGAGDNTGIDVDTLNDRITLWTSKLQNDIQKLAKLTVDPDQILAQVKTFYNELNGEVADLRIKSDQIKAEVTEYVDGTIKDQYSQFAIKANEINLKVENLKEEYSSSINQTAESIKTLTERLDGCWSQVEQTADKIETTVRNDINNLKTSISQNSSDIKLTAGKIDGVQSQINILPDQIKLAVSDDIDSAYILTKINEGDSEVKIKADKIQLDGQAIAKSLMIDGGQEANDLFDKYKNAITSDLQTSINELKIQVDNTIDNWYYEHYPVDWSDASRTYASNSISYNTEHNISQETIEVALGQSTAPKVDAEPYASWIKDGRDDRSAHIGDTFTNTKFSGQSDVRDGRTWKFCATIDSDGNYTNYRWEPLSDSASAAMRSIVELENRVSNKRQVFVDTPTPPYEKGDLWVIIESTDGNVAAKNIYVCLISKDITEKFSNADWISTNNFVGEDIFNTKIDEVKSELVNKINEEVKKVDLTDILVEGGFIKLEDGSYVPANGMISKSTDANGVETLTMRVDGEEITWQTTPGVDKDGRAYLVVNKPWGDPDDPTKSSFVVDQDGLLTARNAIIYGQIHAGAGEIGGIEIHDNNISSSNNNFSVTNEGVLTAKSGTIGGIEINDNSISSGNGNFSVTKEGVLTATNANITGTINATAGTIGGIEIHDNNISSNNGNFNVTTDGRLTAKSGTIGGIKIHDNDISSSNNKFSITADGRLTATDADITGTITASKGTIGGIKIHDNDISSNNNKFSITADGKLTATDVNITGTITATNLILKGTTIRKSDVDGLSDDLNDIQNTANTAVSIANTASNNASIATSAINSANSNYMSLQQKLNGLQSQVNDILNGGGGSSGGDSGSTDSNLDWFTNAFQQTQAANGILLSGNVFVADANGNITAGMMGARVKDFSKTTPRFFAGDSTLKDNGYLHTEDIYQADYPFMVTADGHLHASNADLTGTLTITRTIDGKEKTYDIGEYVIGKTEGNKLNINDTVTGAIAKLNNEVYGPAREKDDTDATYNRRVMNSDTLLGRVLRLEGKIAALKNDVNALITNNANNGGAGGDTGGDTGGNVIIDGTTVPVGKAITFTCPTCGAKILKRDNETIRPSETINAETDSGKTYGDDSIFGIVCPTCGSTAYKGMLTIIGDTSNSGDSGKTVIKPGIRPTLPNVDLTIKPGTILQ